MAKFVQIGNNAYNIDSIVNVWFDENDIWIYLSGDATEHLQEKKADAFRRWWAQADVYKAL